MTIKQNRNLAALLWSFYEGTTSFQYFCVRNISTANPIDDRRYFLQRTCITMSGGAKALMYSIHICELTGSNFLLFSMGFGVLHVVHESECTSLYGHEGRNMSHP